MSALTERDTRTGPSESRASKKRRILVDEPCFADKNSKAPTRFLDFHFDILQSLFRQDTSDNEGIAVDTGVWTTIRSFLQQREQILHVKHEAATMQGIHSEAVRCVENGAANKNNTATLMHQIPATPHMRNNPRPSQKPSPVHSYNNSNKYLSQASASSPQMNDAVSNSSSNHFHIVARLLGRRHKIVESTFQQQADPFQPLLQTTDARILSLQQELHELQQSVRAQDKKQIKDLVAANVYKSKPTSPAVDGFTEHQRSAERSRMAELECNIRLWSLLAEDLRQAISTEVAVIPY